MSEPEEPSAKAPDGEASLAPPAGESKEALARAEAKKLLGRTAIGIAPPAMGSKAPPLAPKAFSSEAPTQPRSEFREEPPTKPGTQSVPPVARPSERPRPLSEAPRAPSEPPRASEMRASTPIAVAARSEPPPRPPRATSKPPPPPRASSRPPPLGGAVTATFGSATKPSVNPAAKIGNSTLIGTAPPPLPAGGRDVPVTPIVPRRRTPSTGMPAAKPIASLGLSGGLLPKITPAAGQPPPIVPDPIVKEKEDAGLPKAPIIRIPHGGILDKSSRAPAASTGTLLCEILVKNGAVTPDMVDKAIAVQEERGGQIGRILVSLGACTEEAIARALIEQLRIRNDVGDWSDISAAARERKDVVGLKVLTRPGRTILVLLLTDLFSLMLAALAATSVHWFRTYSELQTLDGTAWLVVGPAVALCMLTFLGLELYSPMAKSTPDEIRDITFAASLVHLGASVLSTLGDLPIVRWGVFVRTVWWAGTLFLVPVVRALVRNYLSVQPWWGIPVCVLGAAKTGRLVVRTLKAQPRSGLKPVMLLDDDMSKFGTLRASFNNEVMDVYSVNVEAALFLTESQRAEYAHDIFGDDDLDRSSQPISSDHIAVAPDIWQTPKSEPPPSPEGVVDPPAPRPKRESGDPFISSDTQRSPRSQITKDASLFPRGKFAEVDGVPLVGDLSLAPILATRLNIPYAVLAMPGVDSPKLLQIVERIGGKFTHLLIIPDLFGFATMGVPAKSLGGILGVEVRQQLLLPGPRLAKRIMDGALTLFGTMFVFPFLLLIAALIKLDSKGPVFYTQKRLGKDGTYFSAYKFRTMHGDGEERLKAILDADPALRAEYEVYHKLRKDPRVTRIGRILRKFSLDEFPQLLNVIRGDMSLVGPRPYIERELTEMSGQEKIILRAPPGMTGMWQVSDRNATSFAQRVQIDVYYVRNWSPWLDIHILAKTFGVVIKGSGV